MTSKFQGSQITLLQVEPTLISNCDDFWLTLTCIDSLTKTVLNKATFLGTFVIKTEVTFTVLEALRDSSCLWIKVLVCKFDLQQKRTNRN